MCGCAATVPQAHELNPTGGVAPEARPARPLILVNALPRLPPHVHRYPKRAPSEAHMKALIRLVIAVYLLAVVGFFLWGLTEGPQGSSIGGIFLRALLWPVVFLGA